MSVFDWLIRRTPDIDTPAPIVVLSPEPFTPDADDPEETQALEEFVDGVIELEPIYTVIDYVDAKGAASRRRITMLRLKQASGGVSLHAVCHERGAFRMFRCDRIQCFIEPDGEVIDTATFFRDTMLVDLAAAPAVPSAPASSAPALLAAKELRERLRAPLAVLVAAARADDEFHPEELEVIAQYIESEVLILARASAHFQGVTVEVLDALLHLVAKMRTQRSSLPTYLRTIGKMSDDRKARFLRVLERLVAADGVISFSEELFLSEVADNLGLHSD